ncbi:GNAT family N-acetyltransferase [Sphingomonas echinoides]|uniref:GNAT family N-acetyltransferase n=1 Tax=Sphingomonas echinoides TaxID=59803 RepID=UPI00241300C9|nr:GNAT family N-acetyltransferase [Sphingomonas echinoides]
MSARGGRDWTIRRDDLTHPDVLALLDLHLRAAHENSPPGSVFALDASGLRDPAVTVWTAWEGDVLLGMGALKQLDPTWGEVKSMRTAPAQLRRGVAAVLLDRLIAEARARGCRRLSLETGSNAPFAAAHALYRRAGFVECAPFGDYDDLVFAQYFTMDLAEAAGGRGAEG